MTQSALDQLGARARAASREIARSSSGARDSALRLAADLLESESTSLLGANEDDLARAESEGLGETALDRLRLSEARISSMAEGLRSLAGLPDPVGEVVDGWV